MATRDEILSVLVERYAAAKRRDRGRMLDEVVAITGHHRKHAERLLRGETAVTRIGPRPSRRIYDDAVRQALVMAWEAADRICSKRLKALFPTLLDAMDRHGHIALEPSVRSHLLTMSAATIDRALVDQRAVAGRKRRRLGPSSAVRRTIPVRTFSDWGDAAPGFMEADLVFHCGPTTRGSFVSTLVLTDIATGWTECAPLLMREQELLTRVLEVVRGVIPFPLLGFDTDNDRVFMNETVKGYCDEAGLVFTRCRPYRKNDQAWVEQKNGAVVRRIVGHRRYEGFQAAAVLGRLYRVTRLYVNHFQPSFKLAEKERDGAKVCERYHAPATPYARLTADARTPEEVRRKVEARHALLDPIALLRDIRALQGELVALADRPVANESAVSTAPSLDQFLAGLRTAWQDGEPRPTARAKPIAKRLRRRPDPFEAVTETLREWFEAEPWRSSGELLERLRAVHPGTFKAGQIRTLQRRVKAWRSEAAHKFVSARPSRNPPIGQLWRWVDGAAVTDRGMMRGLSGAVEPCASGAPLRGYGAGPHRSAHARRTPFHQRHIAPTMLPDFRLGNLLVRQ